MAINDFTGKNIQDTFQRVVQTDSTNQLADGTGSIFIPISASHAISASYAVSASHEITLEISSSYAQTASMASDNFIVQGHITASVNISSSGQIAADKIRTGGRIASSVFDIACVGSIDTDGTISSTGISNSSTYTGGGRIVLSGASSYIETPSYVSASSLISQTHITASGNISASGDVFATRFTGDVTNTTGYRYPNLTNVPSGIISSSLQVFTNITASGNISASGTGSFSDGRFTGNVGIGTTSPDSLLEISSNSATDFLKLTSGGGSATPVKLIFEKSGAEQGIIEYNRNGDLEIYNTDGDGGVMIDGSTSAGGDLYVANSGNVGIGITTPTEKLQVTGNISASGDIQFNTLTGTINGGTF